MFKVREYAEYKSVNDLKYKVFLHHIDPRVGWQKITFVWITLHYFLSSEQCHVYEMTIRPVRLNVYIKYVSFLS